MASISDRNWLLGTPGVQSTFTLTPAALSARIRNAAAKMIRNGVITGHGQAARVACFVASAANLHVVRMSRWRTSTYITMAVKAHLLKAHKVGSAVAALRFGRVADDYAKVWEQQVKNGMATTITHLDMWRVPSQVLDYLAREPWPHSDEVCAKNEAAAKRFLANEPFTVNTDQHLTNIYS